MRERVDILECYVWFFLEFSSHCLNKSDSNYAWFYARVVQVWLMHEDDLRNDLRISKISPVENNGWKDSFA